MQYRSLPVTSDESTAPIPVILLTGYLGAGKTTVLNQLLACEPVASRGPALIINEFGSLGVDGRLVRPGQWEIFEINKGSVFCVCTKTEFLLTLKKIADEPRPGILLVEATGIAETADIEGFLDEAFLAGQYEVIANVCVVDAAGFTKVAPFLKAASAQVAWADGIVVNKADLAGEAELKALEPVLADMNPRAPRVRAEYGRIDTDFIFSLEHVRPTAEALQRAPEAVSAATIEGDAPVDRDAMHRVIERLGPSLLRLKGNVNFASGRRFVEVAAGQVREDEPIAGEKPTAFVVIAWQREQAEITKAFSEIFT
jgi:G3E family GTPase